MSRSSLSATVIPVSRLDPEDLDAMWSLFVSYYDCVDRDTFEKDLRGKTDVILLRCRKEGSINGFSTITAFEEVVRGRRVVGVFSGDTIVDRAFWNQTALQRAFLSYVMRIKLRRPHLSVYWFLISKGYRTYLLMARNFPEHWPRCDRPTPAWPKAVIDAFARRRFPHAWRPDLGVLRFDEPLGRLREAVAPIDDRARELCEVRFFEEMNPRHEHGDELCCIGKVDVRLWVRYMTKLARRLIRGRTAER